MDLTKLISAIKMALALIPAVEDAVPVPKSGTVKLDLVLGIIADTLGDIADILPILTLIIARVVQVANIIGSFRTPTIP